MGVILILYLQFLIFDFLNNISSIGIYFWIVKVLANRVGLDGCIIHIILHKVLDILFAEVVVQPYVHLIIP